jgi:hypothetical protein
MKKEDSFGIREPAELKRALNQIARNEGREIFLRGGAFSDKEESSNYLQRILARQKKETSE